MKLNFLPVTLSILGSLLAFGSYASTVHAAELEYSGWIPYWAAKTGTKDAIRHLNQLTEVNPFVYSVSKDGTVKDLGKMSASHWKKLIRAATAADVRVMPTVMWSDTANIDRILRDPVLRAAHIDSIVRVVEKNNYDGIDIDYEGKKAETKEYFALFLTELNATLGDKRLACTIEARMPVADRYTSTPPASAYQFANDLTTIGKVCDAVRVMTYDQQNADQKLNAKNANGPYFPVADSAWVEKVVKLMIKDIPAEKLSIGVATYGREVIVTVSPKGTFTYVNDGAFNPGYATAIQKKYKVKASENVAGEQSVSYVAKKKSDPSQKELIALAPSGTAPGDLVALGAKAYAAAEEVAVSFHLLWWSDAAAIADKVALAKNLGTRGIAVFKFDGSEDSNMWHILK